MINHIKRCILVILYLYTSVGTTNEYEKPTYRPILNWQVTNQKVPWGVLVLLGGGFALADASQVKQLDNEGHASRVN